MSRKNPRRVVDEHGHVSFRDPENFAYSRDGEWFRVASGASASSLRTLRESGIYRELTTEGKLLPYEEVVDSRAGHILDDAAALVYRSSSEFDTVFAVPEVGPITYPWEWPNGSLAAAAQVTLEVREALLDIGLDLKDASAFNVQFPAGRPMFIDLGSIQKWRPNPSWNASRQFIEHFVNPLAVGHGPSVSASDAWVMSRGRGLRSAAARSLMPSRLRRRPGLAVLQASTRPVSSNKPTETRFRDDVGGNTDLALKATRSLTRRLRKATVKLAGTTHATTWAEYGSREHYGQEDLDRKADLSRDFVARWVGDQAGIVLDVGGNDGFTVSALSMSRSLSVVLDPDAGALDALSTRLSQESDGAQILPLVGDLTNLSPASGLLGDEFLSFHHRVKPDAVLCQAVLHHIVITQGVPMALAVEALAKFGAPVQIEFADAHDEKVKLLIAQIPNWSGDYSREGLIEELRRFFTDVTVVGNTSPTRVMVEAHGLRNADAK